MEITEWKTTETEVGYNLCTEEQGKPMVDYWQNKVTQDFIDYSRSFYHCIDQSELSIQGDAITGIEARYVEIKLEKCNLGD